MLTPSIGCAAPASSLRLSRSVPGGGSRSRVWSDTCMQMPGKRLEAKVRVEVDRIRQADRSSAAVDGVSKDPGGNAISLGQSVCIAVECHRGLRMSVTFGHGADVHSGGEQ